MTWLHEFQLKALEARLITFLAGGGPNGGSSVLICKGDRSRE